MVVKASTPRTRFAEAETRFILITHVSSVMMTHVMKMYCNDEPLVARTGGALARTDLRGGVVVLLLEGGHGGRGGVGNRVGDLAVQPTNVAAHERVPTPHDTESLASTISQSMQ